MRRLALALVVVAACADLRSAPEPGPSADGPGVHGGISSSSGAPSDAGMDADTGLVPPAPDAAFHPSDPCRPTPAACVDAVGADVIEVPTEMTLANALATADPHQLIQLRGGTVSSDFTLPKDVSLTGCENAVITSQLTLGGGTQTVSNLVFTGQVLASNRGTATLQRDRFVATIATNQEPAALLVTTVSTPAGTELTVAVEDTSFVGRERAISVVGASGSGLANTVTLSVTNGVFAAGKWPLRMQRVGNTSLSGKVMSTSFYDFDTAIALTDLDATTPTLEVVASLFEKGASAVDAARGSAKSSFIVRHSLVWGVLNPFVSPPVDTLTLKQDIDPALVAPEKADLRLGTGSPVLDLVPAVLVLPKTDFNGCPRPAGNGADPGAFESQP